MTELKQWFVIINPTSGNGKSARKWPKIKALLHDSGFEFEHHFTSYSGQASQLVVEGIKNGFRDIISIGGDGTLHNIVNGIMTQNSVPSDQISVGVIPIGTGNDWVRTHGISKKYDIAISIIKEGNKKTQDIGKIELLNDSGQAIYFNNLAGVGFDGFVVSKVHKFKHFGALAYLIGALLGLLSFKNFQSTLKCGSKEISGKTLMTLVGLCGYSGGGMQLTKDSNPYDGLFDISIARNFTLFDIIRNLSKLFNGTIVRHNKVEVLKGKTIKIETHSNELPFIQADGELVGKGGFNATLIPAAFTFYCK